MRTCKKCGRELPEDAIVCPYCNKKKDSVLNGIAIDDGDEVDREYQERHKTCSMCGRTLKSDWEKEHGICVYCNVGDSISDNGSNVPEYKPTSSAWLRTVSRRYDIVSGIIQIIGIVLAYIYLYLIDFQLTVASIAISVGIIMLFSFAGLIYSAIGAHMKGMADIVDGIVYLSKKK